MSDDTLTPKELGIMRHATAWSRAGVGHRNYYAAGPESDAWPILQGLVERGLMTVSRPEDPLFGKMTIFSVMPKGVAALRGYDSP